MDKSRISYRDIVASTTRRRATTLALVGESPEDFPVPAVGRINCLIRSAATVGTRAACHGIQSRCFLSTGHAHQERLASLDFLAVCGFFLSETARLADVVLPSAQWAEEDGTMTNLEGRVLWRRPRCHRQGCAPTSRSFAVWPDCSDAGAQFSLTKAQARFLLSCGGRARAGLLTTRESLTKGSKPSTACSGRVHHRITSGYAAFVRRWWFPHTERTRAIFRGPTSGLQSEPTPFTIHST